MNAAMGTSADNSTPDLRLEMSSEARLLSATRAMIGNFARQLGFGEVQAGQISLAVDEALCNVINHGYDRSPNGRIWVNVWREPGDPPGIRVVIEDLGRQVDPATIKSRDLDDVRPGGLGVFIIREIMDEVTYEPRDEGGMRLTMVRMNRPDAESELDEAAPKTAKTKRKQTGHA